MREVKVKNKEYEIAEASDFSIHTLEVRVILERHEFDRLFRGLSKKCKKLYENPINSEVYQEYIFYLKKVPGINSIKLCRLFGKRTVLFMSAVVNARSILEIKKHAYISIAPSKQLDLIIPKIKEEFLNLEIPMSICQDIYIKRLDYCVNIDLESKDAVLLFIKLLHKGRRPFKLREKRSYDEKKKRWISNEYDYTVKNGMYELSIYSKQKQMEEHLLGDEEERALAEGQVRIELRVCRDKIRYERKRYECDDDEILLCNASEVALHEMCRLLYLMYGLCDFVKKNELEKRINESSFHKSTKAAMLHFSRISNKKYGMDLAYESYKNGALIMQRFTKLGISPICIPDNCEIDRLHSPLFYIAYCNVNNR